MTFVPPALLVRDARDRGYAVPAMNTNGGTYDITRAALEAAQELRAPLILQAYEPNLDYRGVGYFVTAAAQLYEYLDIDVPVALQLDHGHGVGSVVSAMQAGLTGVMFDASDQPLKVNIEQTRTVVREARALGVSVEAEVGYVSGNEPPERPQIGRTAIPECPPAAPGKTDPDEAEQFARETGVDMLAVAVGTTHGVYRRQDDIDWDLLTELRGRVPVPLVAHGTCGISTDDLARLAVEGMSKVNFGEPLRVNYLRYFDRLVDECEHCWHPWRIAREVKDLLKADMIELMLAIGAEGIATLHEHQDNDLRDGGQQVSDRQPL